jgi:hypothetical protein
MNTPSLDALNFWIDTRLRDALNNEEFLISALGQFKVAMDCKDSPVDMIRKVLADFVFNAFGVDPANGKRVSEPTALEVDRLRAALLPFARVAKGIPGNWPGQCALVPDRYPSGTWALNYASENEVNWLPTLADYRAAADAVGMARPTREGDAS